MKNIEFYKILICFGLLWLTYSCEKADQIATNNVALNEQLTSRDEVGSCDQCPENYCCCGLELTNVNNSKTMRLCGTADGTGLCSYPTIPGPCSSISGGGQSKLLTSGDPKLLFCMVKGNSLAITNTSIFDAYVRLTCQEGITNPQTVIDTIPAGLTHFYLINNSCETDECEP
ncbi:MAG TPA: hypothetical protein VN763_06305 [Saprospiraceae bacterium]|nr:hypothetical protein [Saprospiraceae bacterium]